MRNTFLKYIFSLFLIALPFFARAKSDKVSTIIKFHNSQSKNIRVEIVIINLLESIKKKELITFSSINCRYMIKQSEPVKVSIKIDNGYVKKQFSIWLFNDLIEFNIDPMNIYLEDKRNILNQNFIELEQKELSINSKMDSLIKSISFKSYTKFSLVQKIQSVKDSLSIVIDETNKNYFLQNPNTYNGLYAFLKYANQPSIRPRSKHQVVEINSLLKRNFGMLKGISISTLKKQLKMANKLMPGKKIPVIILKDSTGKRIDLNKFRGQILLIDIWATWCGFCRMEFPHLNELYRKYKGENFKLIGISVDESKNMYLWKDAIINDKIDEWPQYLTNYNLIEHRFNLAGIPASFLIDENGKIIEKNLTGKDLDLKMKQLFGY